MTPQYCMMMAEAHFRAGETRAALEAIASGLRHVEELGELVFEPELHRLRGEIQITLGDPAEGEASIRRAIRISQEQEAKMAELRAGISLARLQHSQGRAEEARTLLEPLYDWFQEGFDTPELVEARGLLETLGRGSAPNSPLRKTAEAPD